MCVINSWGYASYFMHCLRAYIASIVILASWCKHCIMVTALCHMHYFDRAWNPPSLCRTIITIIHLNSASRSWLYIEHCTRSWSICHYSLIASVEIGMFCNQHHPNYSGNKLWAGMFQTSLINQSLVLSSLAIHKFCDECRRHLSSSCCDLSSMRTWSPFFLFSCHTHLVILQRLLPSTSILSDEIASCHFWRVICFSSIKSLLT
jgi:hypothetical protein